MTPQSCLNLLSPTRQALLIALKRQQRATADMLAKECYLSVGAVRQHLTALVLQGILRYDEERHGPGRPRHVFSLTPEGENLFPQQCGNLATAILTAIQGESEETRARLLARATRIQYEEVAKRLKSKEKTERLHEFVAALEEYGYYPALRQHFAGAQLDFMHCPINEVATAHPELCDAELACMRKALAGFEVERTGHKLHGADYCSFRIRDSEEGDDNRHPLAQVPAAR